MLLSMIYFCIIDPYYYHDGGDAYDDDDVDGDDGDDDGDGVDVYGVLP